MIKVIDETARLCSFSRERVKNWISASSGNCAITQSHFISTNSLVRMFAKDKTQFVDHRAICEYLNLYDYKTKIINYNNQQLAIEVKV